MRIAVADDEPDVREYFSRILPRLGHEVVAVAATGAELVERCRELSPDVVITDIKMPDMDGLAALEAIRAEHPVRAIVVSGYQDSEHVERARLRGVNAYLVKPIKRQHLEEALQRLLYEP